MPQRTRTLRSRLTVAFGLLFVLLLAILELTRLFGVPATTFHGVIAERRASTFRNLDLVADLKKDRLVRWLAERQTDLRVAAQRGLVIKAAARLVVATPTSLAATRASLTADPLQQRLLEVLQGLIAAYGAFRKISLIDPQTGIMLASSKPEQIGKRHIGLTLGAGQDVGRVHPHSGVFVLPLVTPVRAQGKVVALLVGEVAMDEIVRPILQTGRALGQTGEALLVDDKLRTLTSLRHPLRDGRRPTILSYRIDAEPARRAARGEQGQIADADYRGVQVLASYRSIDIDRHQRWGLVVKQDVAELEAPLMREIMVTLVISTLGLAAMFFLVFVVARNLTAPLLTVTRTADALARGELSARSGVQRDDEIGRVATALDGLAARNEATLQALDQRGAELETAIAEAKQRERVQAAGLALSTALTAAGTLDALARHALDRLLETSHFLAGALYLRSGDHEHFDLRTSVGIDSAKLPQRIEKGEGLEGLAVERRTLQRLEDVPEDTHFVLPLLAGTALPRVLLALPLIHEETVFGVLSLASLKPLSTEQREILALTETPLALSLANALGHQKTAELAHAVQTANEELAVINEELKATNEELSSQARELAKRTAQVEEQKREVEQANRLKSEFLANMSHELRTPLNSVLALTQLLGDRYGNGKDGDKDRSKEREYVSVIDRNARHLLELINDVLDLSRIEAGHLDLTFGPFDAQDVAQQAVDTLRQLAEGKGLKLSLSCEGATALHSDRERLLQILLNLLGNAVKFTNKGEIELLLRREAESLLLIVKDTGIGIPSDFLPHLFQPFRQADGSTTRRHEGTGLGLTIVAQLVEALGGTIEVETEVGRGSTFTVRLPVTKRPEDGPSQPPAKRAAPRPSSAVSLLVVEDNAVASLQLRAMLNEEGFSVAAATHGIDALKQIAAQQPDLIVLDLMMPEMDGFEFLRQLRAEKTTRSIPVLVVTAKELTQPDRERLTNNGVYELVQKGRIDRQNLIGRVRRLLAERGLGSLDTSKGKQ